MSPRARHWSLPWIPAGAFLGFGLATLGDYGLTWDEAESWNAAASNLAMLSGTGEPWAATHVLPGYYFAIDTLRAFFVESMSAVSDWTRAGDRILVHHAFNLLLASASLGLLCALVLQLTQRPRMALLAAGALALMPPFVGHAQTNPKDLPALFVFLLAGCCITGLARAGNSGARTGRWLAGAALALGLALTTRALSAALIPIFGGWLLWRRRDSFARNPGRWFGLLAGAAAAAFALWPWLWDAPFAKIALVFERISIHELVKFQIVYLGELRSWSEMPWHYRPLHFFVALPLVHWTFSALCIPAARKWRVEGDARFDVVALALCWLGVLAVVDQLAPYRYDGIRHFLPALPALAMLVAAGGEWLCDTLCERAEGIASLRGRAVATYAPVGLFAVIAAAQIASTHPYQSAYMNFAANAVSGPHSEEWLEIEYWGQAYADGGRWINANTERDAIVYLPIGDNFAGYNTRRARGDWRQFDARFGQTARPQYVMFITRLGFYDDKIRRLEREYEPVYSLRVQNATLLKIYSNRHSRRGQSSEPSRG